MRKKVMCMHYLYKKCRHGKKGLECKYQHPLLCFPYMDKGKEGCDKEDCKYNHPKMCRYEMNCKRKNCSFFHPRHMKKVSDTETIAQCKFKNECNRKDCKFIHPEKEKEGDKKDKDNTAEKATEATEKVETPKDKSSQVFQKGKVEPPQISDIAEMRTMMQEMAKIINTLM